MADVLPRLSVNVIPIDLVYRLVDKFCNVETDKRPSFMNYEADLIPGRLSHYKGIVSTKTRKNEKDKRRRKHKETTSEKDDLLKKAMRYMFQTDITERLANTLAHQCSDIEIIPPKKLTALEEAARICGERLDKISKVRVRKKTKYNESSDEEYAHPKRNHDDSYEPYSRSNKSEDSLSESESEIHEVEIEYHSDLIIKFKPAKQMSPTTDTVAREAVKPVTELIKYQQSANVNETTNKPKVCS